ncbi:MAG: flagellar hook-associated protein FlgK [Actinomycetota bacterium]|nr:flagellar hook-associated protein FlgK [Actinomycetota bacterium]
MTSSFSGLTDALTALNAARYGMDVTSQNITNANTPGYVRQRAELAESGPVPGVPSLYATQHSNSSATVSGTSRLNDPVVDMRARSEHGRNGYLQTQAGTLSSVEGLFDEPSDNGLAEKLNDFWNSWAAVANNPGDAAARNVVLQKATSLTSSMNETASALARVTQSVNQSVSDTTGQINTATNSLAQINGAIAVASATGANDNSLLDQRDSLLMNLSNLTGAQSTIQANGTATVTIGGQTVVSSTTATAVSVSASNQLLVGGTPAATAGGSMQGLLDGLTTTLPNYSAQLDAVAAALANTTNTAQAAGYDLAGNPGGPLFSGTTAGTISVAVTNPSALAASGTPGGNLGASVALGMSGLGKAAGGPDVSYRTLVGSLATAVQGATQQANVQQAVTTSVDSLAESSSGVSLDEETTNLLTYQRAYQASSRVLTTVDETLDTLISHTGRVGL